MRMLVCVALLVAGCSQAGASDEGGPTAQDLSACNGEALVTFIGQPATQLDGQLPEDARVIGPDTAVTQDYRPDRINVDVDADGNVTGIRCG